MRNSTDVFEIHDRVGYSYTRYRVKDSDGDLKRRRYKPNELQTVGNVENVVNRARVQRTKQPTKNTRLRTSLYGTKK
jgi:hypothetical protein